MRGTFPSWWGDRKVDEYMVVAFFRFFLYGWSVGQVFDDLQAGGIQPGFDEVSRGSNQWSVSPGRSAEGAAILCIDPHLSWWGPSRFWEFRIHAGVLQGSGFTLPGCPYIGLGHNANVAWAMTTGGPDTADVYELTLKDDDPTKYLYDGQWRTLSRREATLEVKGAPPQKITIWSSHHGPIVAMRKGKAYAAKMAYAEEVQLAEAWYEFNTAKDYTGAVQAMTCGSSSRRTSWSPTPRATSIISGPAECRAGLRGTTGRGPSMAPPRPRSGRDCIPPRTTCRC